MTAIRHGKPTPAGEAGTGPVCYDLFAGAGLFSFAFAQEGFRIARAIEFDRYAAETYAANIADHIELSDVRDVRPSGKCEVLIAGPPCQGFSTLGRRSIDDPRNQLSLEVLRWASALKPRMVVVENVSAFTASAEYAKLCRRLRRLGYETTTHVLNAIDFGVAQRRSRTFIIGSRVGSPLISASRREVTTVREAFAGLRRIPDGRNLHFSPRPSALALARMQLIPEGGDKRDVMRKDPSLVPPSWRSLGVEVTDAWGRLRWDEPSNTLRTCFNNPSKGRYIHPDQDRVISLREAARLHSIPDGYTFVGMPIHIARQIGNSVPPLLGRAVARAVRIALG